MTDMDNFDWEHTPETETPIDDSLLFDDNLPADHRSGYVAVIGRPNVGKSTLLNAFLGQKIAITSPKPQTTRNQLLGILTLDRAQIIFLDTPGIHQPHHKFGEYMVEVARRSISDADVILWLVDGSEPPTRADKLVVETLTAQKNRPPVILGMNKIDLLPANAIDERLAAFTALFRPDVALAFSATEGTHRNDLLDALIAHLPPGPRFFPPDQVTDQQTRFIAGEMIREAALQTLRQEVPHALAVLVEEFKERSNGMVYISAKLFVERDSQKGIVIGQGGKTLKQIGQLARPQIEELVGAPVFLELRVSVLPKWRKKKSQLQRLGYSMEQ